MALVNRLFLIAFVIGFALLALEANVNRPRLMILHSYSTDYVWTKEVNVGIDRVLRDVAWADIRYHYMKTKRIKDKRYKKRAGLEARKAIGEFAPQVVIAVDDDAQKYAAKFFINKENISIVFAGVNGGVDAYGYTGASNVTGIFERKPAMALEEIVLQLDQDRSASDSNPMPTVLFLSDNSHSTERDGLHLENFSWKSIAYLGRRPAKSFSAWKKIVLQGNKAADYFLVGGYRKLGAEDGKGYTSAKEVMTWTEKNSPIPVIGMNTFNVADGAALAVGVSPYEQGSAAARMAIDILSSRKKAQDIQFVTTEEYVIALSESRLKERNIQVPNMFQAFARATDQYYP